jgi:hypothetical protein
MDITPFMQKLTQDLKASRSLSDSSARLYIKHLYSANGKQPFKSLAFLRKFADVEASIDKYASSTQKTIVAAIVSALSDKPAYKKAHTHWVGVMNGHVSDHAAEVAERDGGKTQKEKDNWVDWPEVEAVFEKLKEAVAALPRDITPRQYQTLLDYFVLGLYTQHPPRRNADYLNMYAVKNSKQTAEELPKDKNYLLLAANGTPQQFVFNTYKTAKKYGQQLEEISPGMAEVITTYIGRHPLQAGSRKRTNVFKLLAKHDGAPLDSPNSITRVLNRLFGKRVGSSLLRHAYLSGKYNLDEMEADAEAMGHSVAQQREYLRK